MLDLRSALWRGTTMPSLNITPLLDVMLLLLIFFLLAATFARPALEVDLPQAAHSRLMPESKQHIVVSLTHKGEVFLNGIPVTLSELKSRLTHALAQDRKRPVVVQADKQSAFGTFVAVMDAAKGAGAARLIIETTTAAPGESHE